MRAVALGLLVTLMVGLAAGTLSSQTAPGTAPRHEVTATEYESWKKDLSNWGRWGKDDQIGALNLITPAKRKEAAALVKEGFSVSLASDADTVKAVDNPFPYEHEMLAIGNDRLAVRYHGITHTHLDSLAHINDNGVFFNGYKPDADAVLKGGHPKNSIHNTSHRRTCAAPCTTLRCCTSVCICSITATWRRSPTRRPPGTAGISC